MKTINIYINTLLIAISTSLLHVNIHAQTTSNFSTGTTFTQYSLDPWGNTAAIEQGENLLLNSTKIVNQHVMGFGADNTEPYPDDYRFGTIERRIGNTTRVGQQAETIVLTACCAPDWMKGGIPGPENTNWSKEWLEKAPYEEHFDDYAELVAEIVKRPEFSNIQYVQVWNEMKGFWHPTEDRWNYEAYTNLYNKVWNAVKAVRPDIKIGGPYVVTGSYGSEARVRQKCNGTLYGGEWGYFDCRDLKVIEYWLKEKKGADFITVDAHLMNHRDSINPVNAFERTRKFADFMTWLRGLNNSEYPGATTLPVWWAEWYALPDNPNASQTQKNALMATTLVHIIKSGASTALVWGPQGNTNGDMFPLALFTDTRVSGGGQPTIFHTTQKYLYDHFSVGTTLIDATIDDPNIEVLASNDKTLLVNKTNEDLTLNFRGLALSLQGYEVKLIDTPQIGGGTCDLLTNGNFSNGTTDWFGWNCNINAVGNACQITNIQQGANPWNAALAHGNFTLENGKQYEVSFDARSIQNSKTIKVKVGLGEWPWTGYIYEEITLTPVNQYIKIPFTMSQPTTSKARLEFHIGTNTTSLIVDNVRLKPLNEDCPDECEQVKNGNFADGLTDWHEQRCTATSTGNGANITIPSAYPNFWDVALKQRELTYEQGKQYRVSFQAKANTNRSIRVKAGKASNPYIQYHLKKIDLTTMLENHTFTFTMHNTTDNDAFLEFFFGDSATDLFLGDISVVETDCANGLRKGLSNETITHYGVFPNPTNDNLNISLHLTDDYDIGIMRLFDLNGRIIIEEEKELSNSNQFQLNIQAIPAGMYMLRVDVGGYFLTHKVVKY